MPANEKAASPALYDSFIADYYDESPLVRQRTQDVAFYRDAAREYGDPVLETKAQDVTEFCSPELSKLVDDMFESMYAAKGVGLAAPQIGVSKRITVIDTSNSENPEEKLQ